MDGMDLIDLVLSGEVDMELPVFWMEGAFIASSLLFHELRK